MLLKGFKQRSYMDKSVEDGFEGDKTRDSKTHLSTSAFRAWAKAVIGGMEWETDSGNHQSFVTD